MKNNFLHGRESFFAFLALLLCIMLMMLLASSFDAAKAGDVIATAKLRIIDSSIAGLLAILGMAAQALFRVSQSDKDLAATARIAAEKVPPVTGEAKEKKDEVPQDPDRPV